jgi:ribose/xylose/arabinose/galactoside ABC-type transport system permease subunit
MFNINSSKEILNNDAVKLRLKFYIRQYALLLILLVMVVVLSYVSPSFLSVNNFMNIFRQISFVGIAAMGMTFVIIAGGIDLSIGGIAACAGVITSSLIKEFSVPILPAILLGLSIGFLLGTANGIFISRFKIPPFIATVVMMNFARGIAYVYKEAQPIYDLPQNFRKIASGFIGPIPILAIVMLFIFFACHFILKKTVFGRRVYAIGGSENAAKYSGIKTTNMRIYIYAIMGFLAALTGILLAARIGAGDPGSGTSLELDAIAAVVMGGTSIGGGVGGVFGSLIGAVVIGVIDNALVLLNISPWYQPIVKALVILIAVLADRKNKS